VGRKLDRLHLLHATVNGAFGMFGDPLFVTDSTKIGYYTVHYADESTQTIPVIYGEDVRDWWNLDESKEVPRAKIAWTGENDFANRFNTKLRLYHGVWENPMPDVAVTRIDFVSTNNTACAPFCVALTAESKK
jgi:hypothetical protein